MPFDQKREHTGKRHVYGPVSSRRLGQSLGVDLVPMKSCTWNCIYCQLGRTKNYVTERREFFPQEEILGEIVAVLESGVPVDWITLVGSGETMLYKGVDALIAEVKKHTAIPVAVITNGSLFHLREVRDELLDADAVLPSFNAGSPALFELIDRPAPGFTYERHLNGLVQFRKEYKGKLWVEVMLIKGLNDTEEALCDIAEALWLVAPDMVHLVLPTRPAPEQQVAVPDTDRIERAFEVLSSVAMVMHPVKGSMALEGAEDLLAAVSAIVSRHPLQERELLDALLSRFSGDRSAASGALDDLFASGRFERHTQAGEVYWISRQQGRQS
ncbi:MAG: radical SAM protein [Chlorobiaceae bacterium]|nr:radical SAM protein [Chlorobiaceae bacterium]